MCLLVSYECSFAHSVDLTLPHVNSLKIILQKSGYNAVFQYTHPAAIGQLYNYSTHHPPICIYIYNHSILMSFINAFVPMVQMLTPLRKMENPPCFFKIIFLGVRVPGYPMDFPHPRCSSRLTKTRKGLFLGADGLSHFNAMDAGSEGGEINVHADSCPSNFDCRPTAIHSSTGMLPQCS